MENEIGSKEVKMQPVVNSQENAKNSDGSLVEELQKWDKEQLIKQVIQMDRQLYNQNNYISRLRNQIDEMQRYFANKRMEYLFKVVEIANKNTILSNPCFKKDFVEECIAEIQESLTVPEQEAEREE